MIVVCPYSSCSNDSQSASTPWIPNDRGKNLWEVTSMARTKAQAVAMVDGHVQPRSCFVTLISTAVGWAPLTGTGCAHWVAHQLGIIRGTGGIDACDDGNAIRVRDVVAGRGSIPPVQAQPNDIWANTGLTHCGLVASVTPA